MGLWQRIVAAFGRPVAGGFDQSPPYLLHWDWARRRRELLSRMPDWMGGAFARTNADELSRLVTATGAQARLHVVFNIGADALRGYAASGQYFNVYERPVVEGKTLAPSPTRLAVDRLIGLARPEQTYFCALSVGGTGMRFYGEYCVAMKSPQDAAGVRRVLDRNCFDFARPPLSSLLAGHPWHGNSASWPVCSPQVRAPDLAALSEAPLPADLARAYRVPDSVRRTMHDLLCFLSADREYALHSDWNALLALLLAVAACFETRRIRLHWSDERLDVRFSERLRLACAHCIVEWLPVEPLPPALEQEVRRWCWRGPRAQRENQSQPNSSTSGST
jgi:hypothetical protein